jgi:hypothetical protein
MTFNGGTSASATWYVEELRQAGVQFCRAKNKTENYEMAYVPERTVFVGGRGTEFWIGTPLFSDFNINECNLMLFDPTALSNRWYQIGVQRSSTGSKETPTSLKRLWETAFASVLRWVKEGNTLLVLVKELALMELSLSREVKISEDPNKWDPFGRLNLTPRTGNLVEPAHLLVEEFSSFQALFSYQHVLEGEGLVPFYKTSSIHPRNQETVAGFFRHGQGAIVFAPEPREWSVGYLDAITRLREQREVSLDDLPNWIKQYQEKPLSKELVLLK